MINLEFVQTCVSGNTTLLQYYEDAKTRDAGLKLKKQIVKQTAFSYFDIFQDYHVKIETMRYLKEFYVIVTHSQINHIYKVWNN